MNKRLASTLILILALMPISGMSAGTQPKARVIVMTDGEVDDHSSMIRFLLYNGDVDLLAIIQTNSVYQRSGHSKEGWLEKQIAAYEQVYPNLLKHHAGYQPADVLRSKCFVGDEDPTHLIDVTSREKREAQKPGGTVVYRPDEWPDTPGSDKIVEILRDKNPATVYVQAWGGGNTMSRALYKLKTQYPKEYERAVSKVVMYNIWYQDNAGNYIETYHPKVTMLYCASFSGTWDYKSQPNTTDFITNNVKNQHGPLGAIYPQTYISEGDSPSYFYTMYNGLDNYLDPGNGGWGGRFSKVAGFENVYSDAVEDGDVKQSMRRWIDRVNNDYQARMDWCVAPFDEANHAPEIRTGKKFFAVKPGQKGSLKATANDPDGDVLKYKWFQYREAGTSDAILQISDPSANSIDFQVPDSAKPGTLHVLLEVSDNGAPALVSYQRFVLTVK